MRKSLSYAGVTVAALFLAGCSDMLAVRNNNAPSVEASFSTAKGIELLVGGLGVQLNNTQRATESVNTQSKILSGESFASVANFGMAARAQIPRSIISNELGNDNQGGNVANFNNFQRYARNASEAIRRMELLRAAGDSLSTADRRRAYAMSYLVIGQALGYLSLMYDSAAIITPATAPVDPSPTAPVEALSGYAAVNVAALAMLDSAIVYSTGASALPATWISRPGTTSGAVLAQLARSYKARIRAGVARTPADRAAVDWDAVITDAAAGVTANWDINIGGTTGWGAAFDAGQAYVAGGWHNVPMLYMGMADTTPTGPAGINSAGGFGYIDWLKENIAFRRAFLVRTPDRRWMPGETRTAQRGGLANAAGTPLPATDCVGAVAGTLGCPRYIRNRNTGDVPLASWGESWYDHRRYAATFAASLGTYTEISVVEVRMLRAEGLIRRNGAGDIAAAIALINMSRVANGLSDLSALTAATDIVPLNPGGGATNCVPRTPQPPSYDFTACGTLLEAMKYEKRIETMMTGYGISFTDNRGWGDLITGTPLHWPVPYQEMQARQQAYYNGTLVSTGPSTYGF